MNNSFIKKFTSLPIIISTALILLAIFFYNPFYLSDKTTDEEVNKANLPAIYNLAIIYNKFQNEFGAGAPKNYDHAIQNLFSSDFKKIVNGNTLVNGQENLKPQLENVKELFGKWTIEEKQIIPAASSDLCIIRYIISTEKGGRFEVIAILTSSNGQVIDSIDEIYYKIS